MIDFLIPSKAKRIQAENEVQALAGILSITAISKIPNDLYNHITKPFEGVSEQKRIALNNAAKETLSSLFDSGSIVPFVSITEADNLVREYLEWCIKKKIKNKDNNEGNNEIIDNDVINSLLSVYINNENANEQKNKDVFSFLTMECVSKVIGLDNTPDNLIIFIKQNNFGYAVNAYCEFNKSFLILCYCDSIERIAPNKEG